MKTYLKGFSGYHAASPTRSVWTGTVWEDVASSKEGTGCFFLTAIPLRVCEVHASNWLQRGRGPEKKGEIKANRERHVCYHPNEWLFFSFLKDSMHKSQENQTDGSPNSHKSAPGRERASHKYNLIPSSTCDICARR